MSKIKKIEKKSISLCLKNFKEKILEKSNIIQTLNQISLDNKIEDNFIRPITWKIYLDILSNNISNNKEENLNNNKNLLIKWTQEISNQREEYKKKFKKYCKINKFIGDPLGGIKIPEKKSKNEKEDDELKHLINIDLLRTYQNIDLFLQLKTKNLLADILFIWSKENKDLNYKQGMNELLSVFYLSFYPYYFITRTKPKPNKNDIINYINNNQINEYLEDIYIYFNDEEEIKSDLYFVFDSLMKNKGMKYLFNQNLIDINDNIYKSYEIFPNEYQDSKENNVKTYINRRCTLIINEKLRSLDEQLYNHFKKIDLDCFVFLQRWLRCIFNREFEYEKLLILWDAILYYEFENKNNEKYNLIYIDYISIAMIIRIRDDLKIKDQNECFQILFKYPEINNIIDLIKLSNKVSETINERLNGQNSSIYDILHIMKPIEGRPNFNKISPHEYNQKNNRKFSFNEQKKNNDNSYDNKNDNSEFSSHAKILLSNALNSLGKFGGIVKDLSIKVSEKIDQMTNEKNYELNNNNNNRKISDNSNNNRKISDNSNNNRKISDNSNNNRKISDNSNNNRKISDNDCINNQNNNNQNIKKDSFDKNELKISNNISQEKQQINVTDSNNNNSNSEQNNNINNLNLSDEKVRSYNSNDILDIINKLEELKTRYFSYMNDKDKKDYKTIINYLKNNSI